MTDPILEAWGSFFNPNAIILTTVTEWHNLINNPVDLPNENDSCMIALLKDDSVSIDSHGLYGYSDTKMSFYTDDDEYGRLYCDEKFLKHYGQIVAWAISPAFEKMETELNKWLLSKEDVKND